MRDLLNHVVPDMEAPSAALRETAANVMSTKEAHAGFLRDWGCLQTIEAHPPATVLPPPRELTIAAWNMERCKRVEESADLIRRLGADVVLATELDRGMARSGQRHTVRDLAAALGFGYAFAVEFVELGTGDPYETSLYQEVANEHGLHGNAILSRYPLLNPHVIPLDQSGLWFTGSPKSDGQRRVGARMAVTAGLATDFATIGLAAVHFESEGDAAGRAWETELLLKGLERLYPKGPLVIGGDLNTAALRGQTALDCLTRPEEKEPAFAHFAAAGFEWRTGNDGAPTTRAAPGRMVRYPLVRLDWLFARGLGACDPRTISAVSPTGDYLSDHELILARFGP